MDFHANVNSQCQPNVTMDSPVNALTGFYDEVSAKPVKQEPAYDHDLEQSSEFGLDYFPSEESIDLGAYIGGRFDTQGTGDEIVRQLGSLASQERYVNDATPVLSALQPSQLVDLTSPQQPTDTAVMHYQNLLQTTTNVQMNVSHPHQVIGGEQMQSDSIVPESYLPGAFQIDQVVDIETQDVHSTSTSCASSPGFPTPSETADSPSGTTTGSGGSKRKRPAPPPGTVEYKEKRQRNNIAVRKSRLKTKQKNRELQDKVGELQGENSSLKKRVEMLTKELTVLKSLFTNVGKPAPARLNKAVE